MGVRKLKHQLCCHLGIVLLTALASVAPEENSTDAGYDSELSTFPSPPAILTSSQPGSSTKLPVPATTNCLGLCGENTSSNDVLQQSSTAAAGRSMEQLVMKRRTEVPVTPNQPATFPNPKIFSDDPQTRSRIEILPSNQKSIEGTIAKSSTDSGSPEATVSTTVTQYGSSSPVSSISNRSSAVPTRTGRIQSENPDPPSTHHNDQSNSKSSMTRSSQATTSQENTRHANRALRQRDPNEDIEVFNATLPAYLLASLNGTCEDIELSQEATNGFVAQFERSMALALDIPEDHVHVWEITCGALIVNFSVIWSEKPVSFDAIRDHILHDGFAVLWAGNTYAAEELKREYRLNADHSWATLEVGPATGHMYQGFIYIIVGAVLGVILLVIATVFIVRLHQRKGRGFSVSGDSTPSKFSDVNDYTLTRLPRSTKLYLEDVERNPWAYTNPDFHGSLTNVEQGKKSEYVNFVNTGLMPLQDRSPAGTSLLKARADLHGGKLSQALGNPVPKTSPSFTEFDKASAKQKMFVNFHNSQSLLSGASSASRTGSTSLISDGVSALPAPTSARQPTVPGRGQHGSFDNLHI